MGEIARKILEKGEKLLFDNGVEDYKRNACELMGLALGCGCMGIEYREKLELPCEKAVEDSFFVFCRRRISGEPLQYILGEWEFYGLPFKVGEGVLIPRQDSETLVDIVKKKFKGKKSLSVADLCSGTGCIGISLEKNLDVKKLVCIEKSQKACGFLRENVKLNSSMAQIIHGDVFDEKICEMVGECDVIVCNPPYLTEDDMKALQKEVTFEPSEALYGGEDGLDFYRFITRIWKNKLKIGGMLIFEIGINQEDDVMLMLVRQGFENVRCRADLCNINRCVYGFKKEN